MNGTPTKITVRVIARDGKFLGDDIGGAHVTIRDAATGRILSEGETAGGSGPNGPGGLMCAALRRGQPLPDTGASSFTAWLPLAAPQQIEVTAFGPLGARGSANRASATQWVYPGKDLTGGNGFVLELPGLITQILNPPTHYSPAAIGPIEIRANVAMMCGCPIDYKSGATSICPELPDKDQPWLPSEFEVCASISTSGTPPLELPLIFLGSAATPGQFAAMWTPAAPGIYKITVFAFQQATGNTGVDVATVILP
ncbi:MAG: hypothetical protein HY820_07500 [Acidobacteria bacterium]|nr:hypothetical protein [Acidobacteriota bacterium]